MQHKTIPGRMMPKTYILAIQTLRNCRWLRAHMSVHIFPCSLLMMQTLWWFDPPNQEEYCLPSHGFS
jgi:hypothetical protein